MIRRRRAGTDPRARRPPLLPLTRQLAMSGFHCRSLPACTAALIVLTGAVSACRPPMHTAAASAPTGREAGSERRAVRGEAPSPDPEAPPPAPPAWLPLIGEYGAEGAVHIVLERGGQLLVHAAEGESLLAETPGGGLVVHGSGIPVRFDRDETERVRALRIGTAPPLARRQVGPDDGHQLVIAPVRPMDVLRREALAAAPPPETGSFRDPDLVELVRLDSTIHLEVRYATADNLFGTRIYTEARAYLQRPAAEAVARVNQRLHARGLGLLVFDGYRPWWVTKLFWEATPVDKRSFVADPRTGSKHNRGAAVDLTLYDRESGQPIEMVSTYDETSARASADYLGGTSRQRYYRDLLRREMEREGFTVYPVEWWHFDFHDWMRYPIGNWRWGG